MNNPVIFGGITKREALLKKSTGWDNGLSQDYNGKLGTWFADRLGAKQQLRNDMETKNEALELANAMDTAAYFPAYPANPYKQVADMLRSQAAEIERLNTELNLLGSACDKIRTAARIERLDLAAERDQLKAKNEALAKERDELLETVSSLLDEFDINSDNGIIVYSAALKTYNKAIESAQAEQT